MNRLRSVIDIAALREDFLEKQSTTSVIKVCDGTGCRALGSEKVFNALQDEISRRKLDVKLETEVEGTGCPGYCEFGPLVTVFPQQISYQKVKLDDIEEIVEETLIKGKVVERLVYQDPETGEKVHTEPELPFLKKQQRLIMDMNGKIVPTRIEDYIAEGGYSALSKALEEFTPDQVIEEINESGLRGRGGAGFPTGLKWKICKENLEKMDEPVGYLVCNADEGDPGAFMDRSILEGNPHQVIEGMLIGAYGIGIREGFVYLRGEYPLAIKNVRKAIEDAKAYGILGENIMGTDFSFDIQLRLGAGAFVCGEETSLISSIEGRTGEPRPRPPYPAQKGLWDRPTNINNVETWANIPVIIRDGSHIYSSIGTESSKGTKIFSVVGKINNTGLIEVPMGITLREIIFDIGGGIPGGKLFKAVQLGGPSGGCLPAEYLDVAIDYESLKKLGAIMGSGGMVVADEDTCMVDFARYFMTFTQEESCGKCVPCRVGTKAMLATLEKICNGDAAMEDLDYLEELAAHIKTSSLCGLGQSAPNPVLSTMRYFRDEYEAHIKEKCCPARVCKALITYSVNEAKCVGCTACEVTCPVEAITGERNQVHSIENDLCIRCGMCTSVCRYDAIEIN